MEGNCGDMTKLKIIFYHIVLFLLIVLPFYVFSFIVQFRLFILFPVLLWRFLYFGGIVIRVPKREIEFEIMDEKDEQETISD